MHSTHRVLTAPPPGPMHRARALSAAHGQKPPPVLPGRLAAEEAPAEEAAEVSVRWAVLRLTLLRMMLLLLQ